MFLLNLYKLGIDFLCGRPQIVIKYIIVNHVQYIKLIRLPRNDRDFIKYLPNV